MALTKIQPSGLDTTQNYSVNTLSANTIYDGGTEIIAIANTALQQANSALQQANTSFVAQFLFMGA